VSRHGFARDLDRPVLFLTVLGVVYFGFFAGWAVVSFPHYYANVRPSARLFGPLLLTLGVLLIDLGVLARRGYWLFGVATGLFGVGQGRTLARLDRGSIQPLMVGLSIMSGVVALVGLLVQVRERRRGLPR
jgi:hypothetical protein